MRVFHDILCIINKNVLLLNAKKGCKSSGIVSLNIVRKMSSSFCVDNYDAVGFDLDFTLTQYKVPELVKLEYDLVARYLVDEKGYDSSYLIDTAIDMNFIQKGLFIDFAKGNIVKMGSDGVVLKASHGTKFLSDAEVIAQYGANKVWDKGQIYGTDPLQAWNGTLGQSIRPVLDYFDGPSILAYARVVDLMDSKAGRVLGTYDSAWPDVSSGLTSLFKREHFQSEVGGYFSALKKNPSKYYWTCDKETLLWLKELKKKKFTYLITGSNIDYASFTAGTALGNDWMEYFDVVVAFAKKPGFFMSGRQFLKVSNYQEGESLSELSAKGIYSQGNWPDLLQLIKQEIGKESPKCLYFGDNMIQDVYSPVNFGCCKTVAVSAEMASFNVLESSVWGPNLSPDSFWVDFMKQHAEICIPSIQTIARHPVDFNFTVEPDRTVTSKL